MIIEKSTEQDTAQVEHKYTAASEGSGQAK